MKFIPSFGEFATKAKQAFKRFPITISWAIIGTILAIFFVENELFKDEFYGKILLTFVLGISWLISTRFFEEQFQKNKEWLFFITIAFLALFYINIQGEETLYNEQFIRFVLYFIAGHLLVFVAPFILQYDKNAYFNYLKSVFIAIVRSLFFSMILYLGILLALLAIKHLFNVDFSDKRYFQVFVICMGIVNTWIYLSDFPKEIHNQTTINYTKALEVLVKYILIPLVILYLIILYAYSLKILLNWNLPKGWVSYLVVALSFLGFIIQLLINPIKKTIDSKVIRKFYPWFYILLLPLIALLFVAIFRRISDYGITENRYFVLILACWILGMTSYMLISKNKITKWFPLSLAVLALLVSFGFWGVFSISTKSQVKQFEQLFNEIKANNFTTSQEKRNRIQSISTYLSKREETDKLSYIIGYNPKEVFKDDNRWDIGYKLIDSLHIKVEKNKEQNIFERNINYSYKSKTSNSSLQISGYDIMKIFYCYKNSVNDNNETLYKVYLKPKSNIFTIWKSEKLLESIDCSELIKKLQEQNKEYDLDPEFMSVKKGKVKIIFEDIVINYNKEDKTNGLYSANGFLLVKEK